MVPLQPQPQPQLQPILHTDAVVIGAGPVGLFQVFQLGLHGLSAHVVDVLPYVGGQCAQLYADKPIFDLPGCTRCTAQELTTRLHEQIAPFAPTLHLGQQAVGLQRHGPHHFVVQTSAGLTIDARCVFIAAGVGAFMPRTLKVAGLEHCVGRQLHYHPESTAAYSSGQHCVIHGADEAAVAAAIDCATALGAHAPASVTLLHRRDVFEAQAYRLAQLHALRTAGRIRVVLGQIVSCATRSEIASDSAPTLEALHIRTPEGQMHTLMLDQLFVYLGLTPRLGALADWGLALQRKHVVVDTAHFETSEPGIYAVGDVNHYAGKRKLLISGFHEATLAAWAAAESLAGHKLPVEYTSSSALLQRRLGVT